MNNSICLIIQARTNSTRLPGKIFKELCGKPILLHVYNRVNHSKLIDKIIIATTDQPEDNQVENFCVFNNIPFYRGSSDNVLSRYYEAAKKFNAKIIIRITSDCPVIDPEVLNNIIAEYFRINQVEKLDYMSNSIGRTFPRGLDVEIFSMAALEKTFNEAKLQYEHEHVTPYIYNHPEIFHLKNFANKIDLSFHRWTVDTQEDYELIKEIYDALYHKKEIFLLEDILRLFEARPELININKSIKQKKLGE